MIVQVTARRIVMAFACVTLLGWLLAANGITHLPSVRYVAADIVLDILIVVGLWFLWRPAWIFAVIVTALGALLLIFHPVDHAVLLVVGAAQLGLLALPALRMKLRRDGHSLRRHS